MGRAFTFQTASQCRLNAFEPWQRRLSPISHVAAFDFGTTYSGYAFSFRDDPLKVQTNQIWYSEGKFVSLKTPTSVLLNPEGEFDSFGFNRYASKAEDDEHEGWRLFRRFKMVLHNNKELSRATTVEDIEGNSHQALPIFSMAIKFLQKHLLQAVANQTVGVLEKDISYVITVPAIWDDNAKEFIRAAIEEVWNLNHAVTAYIAVYKSHTST
ncbi:heat shock 70 kDa protein 12B-like [Mya arenaria]|uniref:heat shock 70 kDa protein 12B-like n=1 Tax=Mya arenaria TaxID=6604 RepID=UPI0022E5123D|nr:heat shock 70 kDa protein 12B-like [Mya arenaria]